MLGHRPGESRVYLMWSKVFDGEIEFSNLHLSAARCPATKCCAMISAKHGKMVVCPMHVLLKISWQMPYALATVLQVFVPVSLKLSFLWPMVRIHSCVCPLEEERPSACSLCHCLLAVMPWVLLSALWSVWYSSRYVHFYWFYFHFSISSCIDWSVESYRHFSYSCSRCRSDCWHCFWKIPIWLDTLWQLYHHHFIGKICFKFSCRQK